MRAKVIATAAVSPLGRDDAACSVGAPDAVARVAITHQEELSKEGFSRTLAARVPDACLAESAPESIRQDRASHLFFTAVSDLLAELDQALPDFREKKLGIAIGSSSGGMRSAERLFEEIERGIEPDPELCRASTYFAPFQKVLSALGLVGERRTQLVTACSASTWAIGTGLRWLSRGAVDLVIAGGYDAHGPFVQAGFDSLRATSLELPAPFRVGRSGMALGEGAGLVAMVRERERGRALWFVSGFGAATDAIHITAPDRTGDGLHRAARRAIEDASVDAAKVRMVSAHATSTPFNDAMEARAIRSTFDAAEPVVHPFKAQIGHTLGAAGVLETLAIADAIERSILPASAGEGALDEDARVRLLSKNQIDQIPGGFALKQSAAFGGANAALVIEPSRAPPRAARPKPIRPVHLAGWGRTDSADLERIARATGYPADRLQRFDELSLLAATAAAAMCERSSIAPESLRGSAVLVGHSLATIDINHRFYARVLAKGPTLAEPKLFPPTSPNLVPGQLAILFGLTGPSAACTSDLAGGVEALEVALELCAAGDAETVLVVAVDPDGPSSRRVSKAAFPGSALVPGAACVLLSASPSGDGLPLALDPPRERRPFHTGLLQVLGLG